LGQLQYWVSQRAWPFEHLFLYSIEKRFFRLKTGVGMTHFLALYKSPGDPVNPAGADYQPFYDLWVFPELGLHFRLSKRFTLEGNYLPFGYQLKDLYGNVNTFNEGVEQYPSFNLGGIQLNYRF
jgi:hypothetical protein